MTLKCKVLTSNNIETLINNVNKYTLNHHRVFDVQIIQNLYNYDRTTLCTDSYYAIIKENVVDNF